MSRWPQRMVDAMVQARAAGADFESAWAQALLLNPPGRREVGQVQLTLYGKRDESMEEFLKRVCEDAWENRKPLLRHLPSLVEGLAEDWSAVAVDGRPSGRAQLVA